MFSRVNIIFPKKHSTNLLFNLLTRRHHVIIETCTENHEAQNEHLKKILFLINSREPSKNNAAVEHISTNQTKYSAYTYTYTYPGQKSLARQMKQLYYQGNIELHSNMHTPMVD